MSIYADPLFIAAEVEWRYDTKAAGYWPAPPARTGRHGLRRVVAQRWHHRHARHAAPRVA